MEDLISNDHTKRVILIVDDEPFNLDLLELAFSDLNNIEILRALNGKKAIDILRQRPDVDIIILDLYMPIQDGFETIKYIKKELKKDIPIVVITADPSQKHSALELGAIDFISKPFDLEEVKLRTLNYIDLKRSKDALEGITMILEQRIKDCGKETKEAYSYLEVLNENILEILGNLSEYRDTNYSNHIKRTKLYAKKLLELIGLEDDDISMASMLHDIGKIAIPNSIILKADRLTPEEFEIVKMHTSIGYRMLYQYSEKFPILKKAAIIAYTHHEKWDGTGYPNGLRGESIPIEGRIVAIIDVFDALVSKRVYKPPVSYKEAFSIIKESSGVSFDPSIVDVFLSHKDEFIKIKEENDDPTDSINPKNPAEFLR